MSLTFLPEGYSVYMQDMAVVPYDGGDLSAQYLKAIAIFIATVECLSRFLR